MNTYVKAGLWTAAAIVALGFLSFLSWITDGVAAFVFLGLGLVAVIYYAIWAVIDVRDNSEEVDRQIEEWAELEKEARLIEQHRKS